MAQTRPWIAAETSNPSQITVTDRTASGPAPDGTPPTGNVDWSSLVGTPTSAAGYGIVNGSELDAFAALGATGLVTRTAANTYAARTLTAGDNVTITNGSGVAGNPSISVPSMPWADVTGTPTTLAGYGITDAQPLDTDLTTIAGLADIANSVIQRKSGSWAARTLAQYWTDLLADPTVAAYAYTALPWTISTNKRLLGRDTALPPFSAAEIAIGTGLTLSSSTLSLDSTAAVTSITGTANEITASASVGSVTLSLPSALTFTGKTITGGTFASPTFTTPALGTPVSGVVTNLTGTASININGTVGATTRNTGAFTSLSTTSTLSIAGGQYMTLGFGGAAAPSFTSRSVGTKVVLWDALGASAVDYALGIDANTLWLSVPTTGDSMKFYTGTTYVATVAQAGVGSITGNIYAGNNNFTFNVGSIDGVYGTASGFIAASYNAGPAQYLRRRSSDGEIAQFWRDNTQVGNISVTTTATAYNTSSDARLKTRIRDFAASGPILDAIKPRIFDWKTGEKDTVGFIAQELAVVYPAAVTKGDNNETKIEQQWAVDYSKLVPVLVAEIKALRGRVAVLEN